MRFLLLPILILFITLGNNSLAADFSETWESIMVINPTEGDTTTYIIEGEVPDDGGSGFPVINAGAIMTVTFQVGCMDPRHFTGGTFNGISITPALITDSSISFTVPVQVEEDSTFFIVLHGIANPVAGTYNTAQLGIKATVLNNSSGTNTFDTPDFTITPYIPSVAPPQGKNMVTNHSFESYNTCPSSGSCPFTNVNTWYSPTGGTPDYYHECSGCGYGCNVPANRLGYRTARSGGGYAGLFTTGTQSGNPIREYLQTQLACPMEIGSNYKVEIYVSSARFSKKATDGFGILLSTDSVNLSGNGIISRPPQLNNNFGSIIDTSEWTVVGGIFTADSAYTFITIGNFLPDSLMDSITRPGYYTEAYYYVDDVSVEPFTTTFADTSICLGDSTTLYVWGGTAYQWSTGDTTFFSTVLPTADSSFSVVVFYGACTDTVVFDVHVHPIPVAAVISTPDTICKGDTTTLSASGGLYYFWNTGDADSVITVTPDSTTTYIVTVTNGYCVDTASVEVVVHNQLQASVSTGFMLCLGDTATLYASGGTSYVWSTGETTDTIKVSPSSFEQYYVTVSDSLCSVTIMISVAVIDPPSLQIIGIDEFCEGTIISTTLTAEGMGNFEWSEPGTGNEASILVMPDSTTTYYVIATNVCDTDTAWHTITVHPIPIITLSPDTILLSGETIQLFAGGGVNYTWFPDVGLSCVNCPNPIAAPAKTTSYKVFVVDEHGCLGTDSMVVAIDNTLSLYVPNIFSPNGDGNNEVFYVRGGGISKLSLAIYNRWGEKVFETTDQQQGWDGTFQREPVNAGVFVYHLSATLRTGEKIIKEGTVAVVR